MRMNGQYEALFPSPLWGGVAAKQPGWGCERHAAPVQRQPPSLALPHKEGGKPVPHPASSPSASS